MNKREIKKAIRDIENSSLFDKVFYLKNYSDVRRLDMDPIEHYVRYGAYKGYAPNDWFDGEYYRSTYPDVDESGLNPFVHYLRYGRKEGRLCHPEEEAQSTETAQGREWTEEEKEWYRIIEESGLFDGEYYWNTYEDARLDGREPLAHYIEIGAYKGYAPNEWFDVESYWVDHPDLVQSGINPFVHYITQKKEGNEKREIIPKKLFVVIGVPRSGLTLTTAILGAQRNVTPWFLPYATRKDFGIEPFENPEDLCKKYNEAFPGLPIHSTMVISESSAEDANLEFLAHSLRNLEQSGVDIEVFWLMRDIRESYLSLHDAARLYWGAEEDQLSYDSFCRHLELVQRSFRAIFENFYRYNPRIIAFEHLMEGYAFFREHLGLSWVEEKEHSKLTSLPVAGDPFFTKSDRVMRDRSDRRKKEWQEHCHSLEEVWTTEQKEFIDWYHRIKNELGDGSPIQPFAIGRGREKFDEDYYRAHCENLPENIDLWSHYLESGFRSDTWPNSWFDVSWYRSNAYGKREIPELIHFETVGWPFFHIGEEKESGRMEDLKIIDPETFEITPDLLIEVPKFESPKVSILIPQYNQENYTLACIQSIVENTEGVSYEIIVMDDKSPNPSATEIERNLKNVKFVVNGINYGFLKNCNKGAEFAVGEYILFLNNDTNVQPGWLSSLVELIESSDDIGMVGSRLVYPDGRQQEAGGIIWNDASGWNFGRLDDPNKPEYNYVKESDYLTGAAMMIRASLWKEIGGFDERYVPAYFEDSDLAFEVRKHGYRAMYQPKSVVIHFEGISHGTDVGTGTKRYQVINRENFIEKWKDVLERDQFPNGQEVFLARDRSRFKKHLLMIDHYLPHFDQDAGSRTVFGYLQMFTEAGYQVHFIGDNFYNYPGTPYLEALTQMGVEVLYGNWYANHWEDWLKENGQYLDYVFLNRPHISEKYIDVVREKTNATIIYYGHDLHFLRELREYQLSGNEEKLQASEEWKVKELTLMRKADVSFYPSETEVETVHEIDPNINIQSIPAYLFSDFSFCSREVYKTLNIMFVGGFSHYPNVDGVLWFVEEVFPLILEKRPDIHFHIIGSKPPEEIISLDKHPNIHVVGYVTDDELRNYYELSRIAVVPLRFGAGVKGKVVEALYQQIPIVTTSVGAEGLKEAERYMIVADEARQFAIEVLSLYDDEERLQLLSEGGRRYCSKYFSREAAKKALEKYFEFNEGVG